MQKLIRERKEDIPVLVQHFCKELCKKYKINFEIGPKELGYFFEYSWPGNIRELKNFIHRLFALYLNSDHSDKFKFDKVSNFIYSKLKDENSDLKDIENESNSNLQVLEKEKILSELKNNSFNRAKTAESLGISRSTLWRKMKKYNIC
ncbi:MAG TPA: helix-turn-helix domain-containing protein [Tissierellaceae bacterium]